MNKHLIIMAAALGALAVIFFGVACEEEPTEPDSVPVYRGGWGEVGTAEGEFDYPSGIAVAPDSKVYVADSGNSRIQYFTPTGSFLGKWDVGGPRDIEFGPDGNLYCLSFHNGLYCFTKTGSQVRHWGYEGSGAGGFYQPRGIACAPDGKVYVADTYHYKIQYFTSTGSFLGSWGTYGEGNGEFDKPSAIAVSSNGAVYIADTGNDRVQYFSPTGSFLGKFNRIREVPYHFSYPHEVAFGPDGKIFVGCYIGGVYYFTPEGDYLGILCEYGLGNGKVVNPNGIAASGKGVIYVTETANNSNQQVQYFW
jgi:tripartite motif-containing protein 71